jgi:hypothetical protein
MGWWVDPRICSVRVPNVQAYLMARGYKFKPQPVAELLFFVRPIKGGEEVRAIPASEDFDDYLQRIIDVITSLAAEEERYAVEVLEDILRQVPTETPLPSNGQKGRGRREVSR